MNRGRLILIGGALLTVLIIALGFVIGVQPLLTGASQADQQRTDVEAQNQIEQAKLDVLKQQFANLEDYRAALTAMNTLVPAVHDLESFYDEIAVCNVATGETATSIVTGEASQLKADEAADIPAEISAWLGNFHVIPVTIQGSATADQALGLISCLRAIDRLLLVTSVQVGSGLASQAPAPQVEPPRRGEEAPPAPGGEAGPVSINGFIYVLNAPDAPAAAAPAGDSEESAG